MTETGRDGLPIVAIVGRPNVGKSMLFNRLTRTRAAVVDDQPGVTRDRHYRETDWGGRAFVLVDTGGLVPTVDDGMTGLIKIQASVAMDEADVIVFVVDRTTGATAIDMEIASLLRTSETPLILAVNKVDGDAGEIDVHDFHRLGLGEPHAISALHGRGTGDLMDQVVELIPETEGVGGLEGIRVALVGRPNVGKSSLTNMIAGRDITIVDSTPGTTRDAIDTIVIHDEQRFVLIDTAGLRRKSKIERGVEYYSAMRALKSIERADVVVLVVDATTGIVSQDARIAGFADDAGKGLLIVYNKWDLINKDNSTAGEYVKRAEEDLPFARYAPVLHTSALTGQRATRILTMAADIYAQASNRLKTSKVNQLIHDAADRRPPKAGRRGNILYATQVGVRPPSFVVFVSDPRAIDNSYRRYLVNQLRREYGFVGTPIRILVRKRR
ncbi:ribosome biogenesis GTPase Der [bacterium]|nr:ribosome biogenesis GTPase Der [bacterium]